MTSHRGSGSTVLRAPDKPACPVDRRQLIVVGLRRRQTEHRTSRTTGVSRGRQDVCPAECGDRHRTGAEAQSLPPPDAKGSGWVDEPPNYKTRLVVATLPSSRLLKSQMRKQAW